MDGKRNHLYDTTMTSFLFLASRRSGPVYLGYSSDPIARISQIQTSNHKELIHKYCPESSNASSIAQSLWEDKRILRLRPMARGFGDDGGGWFDLTFAEARRSVAIAQDRLRKIQVLHTGSSWYRPRD